MTRPAIGLSARRVTRPVRGRSGRQASRVRVSQRHPVSFPYRPRSLSADGRRLFFTSLDAVTPGMSMASRMCMSMRMVSRI